ncbi:MAG: M24 family metallopeptidase [Pirellulales bacterium]
MSRHELRRDRLRKLVHRAGADALLVTNFTNVTYLTGFTGDDSYLLIDRQKVVVLSDPRYTTQLEQECPGLELAIRQPGVPMVDLVAETVQSLGIGRLGIEGASLSVGQFDRLVAKVPGVEWVKTAGLVEQLRLVKDREEVERIRRAAWQARRGFEVIRASLCEGQTERQVAFDLEHQMRRFGASGASFPPIVAVGERAALPHAVPTEREIGSSPFVLVDWGADEGLYASDLTRMIVTGKISTKLRRVYGVVLRAQQAAIRAIRPGVTCEEVDAVARKVISRAGFGAAFGHGLGHGIGLEVHEGPRLSRKEQTVLKPGMVVTVEPGIYLPEWGGVRIEDDVLVTRGGHEVLTAVPSELEACVVT